jgi:hypothetical protein
MDMSSAIPDFKQVIINLQLFFLHAAFPFWKNFPKKKLSVKKTKPVISINLIQMQKMVYVHFYFIGMA